MQPFDLATTFVALNDSCQARPLPVTDTFWPDLTSGQLGELSRLISTFRFDSDWQSWERHPAGEEFVCLLDGEVELHLEKDGVFDTVLLDKPGAYVLVPPNTWHTAKVRKPARMIFVTPGQGTENRAA